MNNIKLTIFTGVQDTDIIDIGLYNPSISGILDLACSGDFVAAIEDKAGESVANIVASMIDNMNTNVDDYKGFHIANLLAAQDYLNKLKIACDTFPACIVKIESLDSI